MTIEKTIDKILDRLNDDSFKVKGTKMVPFDTVKSALIDLQLNVTLKKITDNSTKIWFTIPTDIMHVLKEDIAAYIHDYIIQRISYTSLKEDELRYWRFRDKIKKALEQS